MTEKELRKKLFEKVSIFSLKLYELLAHEADWESVP